MSLTPEKLRAYAKQAEVAPYAPIAAKDCEMLADSVEIADSSARSHIECCCRSVGRRVGGWWYDTTKADAEDMPWIEQELRYLETRGLLIRQEGAPHIVSFRSDPQ